MNNNKTTIIIPNRFIRKSFLSFSNERFGLKAERKRKYHRESRVSKAEIMVIMILFHSSGYRCLKHFYLEKVCKHMRHLFPEVVSYNRWSSESRSQTCLDVTLRAIPNTDMAVPNRRY